MDSEYQFEITSIVFNKNRMKEVFKRIVGILISENIENVEITFGFAWGNEIYEAEWLPISVTPSKIEEMVDAESNKGRGEIGSDDFYIEIKGESIQIQACHENDIHIKYNTETLLLSRIKSVILPEEWAWKKKKGGKDWEKLNPTMEE